jgi:hypothetical protein
MTSEESDSKNFAIRRQALVDLKTLIMEMLEMDADQVMWNHVHNLAGDASSIQDELNQVEEE